MLSAHLSGYATLRRFYDLRDADVAKTPSSHDKTSATPALRPKARARAAASALMVLISSSASPIQGGLYDSTIETAVPVDVLLPLFGEALVFLNTPHRTLRLPQLYALLAAIEDFATAGRLVKTQCEEVLQTALSAARGDTSLPDPKTALKHSNSNSNSTSGLGGSVYSLIGSQDFSVSTGGGNSAEGSAVFVPSATGKKGEKTGDTERGWDWRRGFPRGASGEEVIRVLRLGVAREVARAFAEGEVSV